MAKHHSFNHKNFMVLIHTRNAKNSYKDNLLLSKWDKTWTKFSGKKSIKDSPNSCSKLLILKTNREKSSKFNYIRQTKFSNNLSKNNNYPSKTSILLKHNKPPKVLTLKLFKNPLLNNLFNNKRIWKTNREDKLCKRMKKFYSLLKIIRFRTNNIWVRI